MTENIYPGLYRHFKGHICSVLAVCEHTETHEKFVAYEHRDDKGIPRYWVRPLKMFCEEVEHQGQKVPRFTRIIP